MINLDLDPKCLTLDGIPDFFPKKLILVKNQQTIKQYESLPGGSILSCLSIVLKVYNRLKGTRSL